MYGYIIVLSLVTLSGICLGDDGEFCFHKNQGTRYCRYGCCGSHQYETCCSLASWMIIVILIGGVALLIGAIVVVCVVFHCKKTAQKSRRAIYPSNGDPSPSVVNTRYSNFVYPSAPPLYPTQFDPPMYSSTPLPSELPPPYTEVDQQQQSVLPPQCPTIVTETNTINTVVQPPVYQEPNPSNTAVQSSVYQEPNLHHSSVQPPVYQEPNTLATPQPNAIQQQTVQLSHPHQRVQQDLLSFCNAQNQLIQVYHQRHSQQRIFTSSTSSSSSSPQTAASTT